MIEYHASDDEGEELEAIASADAVNSIREAGVKATAFFKRWAMAINSFDGNTKFAYECGLLGLGWFDVVGVDSQSKLAERWKCEKENVRKTMTRIQKMTGAPPLTTQRDIDGRKKMTKKRKGQLK